MIQNIYCDSIWESWVKHEKSLFSYNGWIREGLLLFIVTFSHYLETSWLPDLKREECTDGYNELKGITSGHILCDNVSRNTWGKCRCEPKECKNIWIVSYLCVHSANPSLIIIIIIIITYLYSALYNHKTTLSALH